MKAIRLVVPCYNEATRLNGPAFLSLVDTDASIHLLFVNDSSTDDTLSCLHSLAAQRPGRIGVCSLSENRGKAEAVRVGLLKALQEPGRFVGYADADLATPPEELYRLIETMAASDADVLIAARVGILGANIERTMVRHYLGRAFASMASLVLKVQVYDTQCGAKLLRPSMALEAALATPFISRWAFDVELLGRLLTGAVGVPPLALERIVEIPLRTWKDVPGSKLQASAMLLAAGDLARIAFDLARRRRAAKLT